MRRICTLSLFALFFGIVVGSVHRPPPVLAACGLNTECGDFGTVTSSLTVDHYDIQMIGQAEVRVPVEPNNGDTWAVTARYQKQTAPPPGTSCDCNTFTATASVDVTWTGSAWSATCLSGCAAGGPIYGVSVCTVSSCSSGATHSWEYELIVDVDNNIYGVVCNLGGFNNARLYQVDYDTSAVDNGDTINIGNCTEVATKSPTSQSWSASDTSSFECTFTCAAASGPSVSIVYD